ncbi:hypothetical protein ACN47E_009589 [Coniothyrium glycines]
MSFIASNREISPMPTLGKKRRSANSYHTTGTGVLATQNVNPLHRPLAWIRHNPKVRDDENTVSIEDDSFAQDNKRSTSARGRLGLQVSAPPSLLPPSTMQGQTAMLVDVRPKPHWRHSKDTALRIGMPSSLQQDITRSSVTYAWEEAASETIARNGWTINDKLSRLTWQQKRNREVRLRLLKNEGQDISRFIGLNGNVSATSNEITDAIFALQEAKKQRMDQSAALNPTPEVNQAHSGKAENTSVPNVVLGGFPKPRTILSCSTADDLAAAIKHMKEYRSPPSTKRIETSILFHHWEYRPPQHDLSLPEGIQLRDDLYEFDGEPSHMLLEHRRSDAMRFFVLNPSRKRKYDDIDLGIKEQVFCEMSRGSEDVASPPIMRRSKKRRLSSELRLDDQKQALIRNKAEILRKIFSPSQTPCNTISRKISLHGEGSAIFRHSSWSRDTARITFSSSSLDPPPQNKLACHISSRGINLILREVMHLISQNDADSCSIEEACGASMRIRVTQDQYDRKVVEGSTPYILAVLKHLCENDLIHLMEWKVVQDDGAIPCDKAVLETGMLTGSLSEETRNVLSNLAKTLEHDMKGGRNEILVGRQE